MVELFNFRNTISLKTSMYNSIYIELFLRLTVLNIYENIVQLVYYDKKKPAIKLLAKISIKIFGIISKNILLLLLDLSCLCMH